MPIAIRMSSIKSSQHQPRTGGDDITCEICGAQMIQRQCKIRCPNCGFTRDCSDP